MKGGTPAILNELIIVIAITIISSLSMAGVPPFNGFLSKEKFLESMIDVTHANVFSLNSLGILRQSYFLKTFPLIRNR